MTTNNPLIPPSFLSWEFHTAFFPRLIWSRLRPKKAEPEGVSFSHNMELTVLVFVCMALLAFGVPMAVGSKSLMGWGLVILGFGGILFIMVNSIAGQRGLRPTYEDFQIWIFIFFVFLGFSGELFFTSTSHQSRLIVFSAGVLGILPGYILGIFAGFWAQSLGWISSLINGLAGLAIFGLIIVDMLMLVA